MTFLLQVLASRPEFEGGHVTVVQRMLLKHVAHIRFSEHQPIRIIALLVSLYISLNVVTRFDGVLRFQEVIGFLFRNVLMVDRQCVLSQYSFISSLQCCSGFDVWWFHAAESREQERRRAAT